MTLQSERGRILLPNLDDRTWQNLVDEMVKQLIPKYAPQWTDHNPSDLGITLIELFAWLVEGLIYRLNRVPEKNYIAMLNLLGIKRDPPTPARTFLTFTASEGVTIPKGTQAQTAGTETEAPIVFETDDKLDVLPIKLEKVLLIRAGELEFTIEQDFSWPAWKPVEVKLGPKGDTNDTAWICLGFDKPITEVIRLSIQLGQSSVMSQSDAPVQVGWRYSNDQADPAKWGEVDGKVSGEASGLTKSGVVNLRIPANWKKQQPQKSDEKMAQGIGGGAPAELVWDAGLGQDLNKATGYDPMKAGLAEAYFWIGIQLTNEKADKVHIKLDHILFNAVEAFNVQTVKDIEKLGSSTGEPFQVFRLKHYPLFPRSSAVDVYGDLKVEVGRETWSRVEDIPFGPGKYYRLDPVSGEIQFGNFGERIEVGGNGTIPPKGQEIQATGYRYVVNGSKGNLPAGRITVLPPTGAIPGNVSVRNQVPASGGTDEEPIEETKRRAPTAIRNRDRAVTAEDYEYLAREASTRVAIVKCLPPIENAKKVGGSDRSPGTVDSKVVPQAPPELSQPPLQVGGIDRSPGMVNVIIVPKAPLEFGELPLDEVLRKDVDAYLQARRTLTATVKVLGPDYVPVKVQVTVRTREKLDAEENLKKEIQKSIFEQLRKFLHPVLGGPEGRGWSIGDSLSKADLYRAISVDKRERYVESIIILLPVPTGKKDPPYVKIQDHQVICLGNKSFDEKLDDKTDLINVVGTE